LRDLQFWKIVAGWRDYKSVVLGGWLRHNYVSIGFKGNTPQGKAFKEEMQKGDKIVVVSGGFVWALGVVESDMKIAGKGSHPYSDPYPYRRKVTWTKVCKVVYKDFPISLYNKLKSPKALVKLGPEDWQTLLACLR